MGDFTALPVADGVGDYHFNRFRIAFRASPKTSPEALETLVSYLLNNFPVYLTSGFAKVEFGGRHHKGQPTLHFHGYAKVLGLDLAKPHDDWVALEWIDQRVGFTAQTLKREFANGDDVGTGVGVGAVLLGPLLPAVGIIGAVVGTGATIHYNRMHFLAGRRSWRISPGTDFGLAADVIVLETIAVERFSAWAYRTADAVIGLESRVPDVWIALLNNFVEKRGLTVVPQALKSKWKNKNRVDYVQLSFGTYLTMLGDPEVAAAYPLYPSVFA